MNVARFAGEDDRRRFYGEPDPPPPPEQVDFGRDWTTTSDPGGVYAVRWNKETREIYAVRRPQTGSPLPDDAASTPSWVAPITTMEFGAELLGWAESLDVLQEALDGWPLHMAADDSLQWVRDRLGQAAAKSERRRGVGAPGPRSEGPVRRWVTPSRTRRPRRGPEPR